MNNLLVFVAKRARIMVVLTAVGMLLGYTGSWHWLAELFAHFFIQYWLIALLAGVALFLARDRAYGAAAITLFCLASFALAPYYLVQESVSVVPGNTGLKLLQFNAAQDPERVIEWLERNPERADVVVLLEATPNFQVGIKRLRSLYPHVLTDLRHGPFGIALLSKFPLDSGVTLDLAGDDYPALAAKILPKAWPVPLQLYAIHPPPPISGELAGIRNRYMEKLATLTVANPLVPSVVVGDANSTPWSPWFRDFVQAGKLRDSQGGLGLLATWPAATAKYSPLLGIPIDVCLVSDKLHVAARYAGPDFGSDHLPVITELRMR